MASIETLIRYKKNEVEKHRRTIAQINGMIANFEFLADSLDSEIHSEEDRTKNHDPLNFAYSTLAKATIQRRNNLKQSTDKLKTQLDAAEKALSEATADLQAAEDQFISNCYGAVPAV